jgi:hypothetical protein
MKKPVELGKYIVTVAKRLGNIVQVHSSGLCVHRTRHGKAAKID